MPSPFFGVGLQQMHGAAGRVDPAATTFPHGDEHHDLLVLSQRPDPTDSEEEVVRRTRGSFEAMQPFFETGIYVNNLPGDERVGGRRMAGTTSAWQP